MVTYLFLIGFGLSIPQMATGLLRMPITHAVSFEQRVLQIEAGYPVKVVQRTRLELLMAAL